MTAKDLMEALRKTKWFKKRLEEMAKKKGPLDNFLEDEKKRDE